MKRTKWVVGSKEFNAHRIKVIRERHGVNAFKKYGRGTPSKPGGNPVLRWWKQGKLKFVK